MKKLLLLFALVFCLQAAYSQSNLPNGSFENWTTITLGAYSFEQIDGPYWSTLNELAAVPPPIGPGPTTVFKEDNAHSGNWCAKLKSENFVLTPNDVFIPGMMGFTELDMPNATIHIGRPCPGCKPTRFYGYYKFEQVGADSCAAVLLASKWNPALMKKDTIGYCRQDFKVPVSEWTLFDMNVNYLNGETPDSLTIILCSSGGFNVVNLYAQAGNIGNTMWVDDISLDYPLGISQSLMPEIGLKAYPNPARTEVTIELSKAVANAVVEVYNMEGKFIGTFSVDNNLSVIPVSNLSNGNYHYKLIEGKTLLNTGFFTVQK